MDVDDVIVKQIVPSLASQQSNHAPKRKGRTLVIFIIQIMAEFYAVKFIAKAMQQSQFFETCFRPSPKNKTAEIATETG
jgi:hypothetical protein